MKKCRVGENNAGASLSAVLQLTSANAASIAKYAGVKSDRSCKLNTRPSSSYLLHFRKSFRIKRHVQVDKSFFLGGFSFHALRPANLERMNCRVSIPLTRSPGPRAKNYGLQTAKEKKQEPK